MKISLITVTCNAQDFIEDCVQSVISQTYSDIEYIVIDGNSADNTLKILSKYKAHIHVLISEKDEGIYHAMNKGIGLATGEIIGMLNADDFFASEDVLSAIARTFESSAADIVYGDVWYVNRYNVQNVVRKWKSKTYKKGLFQFGWMPAHPAFYCRSRLFKRYGNYNPSFKSAADYELMLRFVHKFNANAVYLQKVFVKMRIGGVSNLSLKNRLSASVNDFKAMRLNGIKWPLLAIILKPLGKISQFIEPWSMLLRNNR